MCGIECINDLINQWQSYKHTSRYFTIIHRACIWTAGETPTFEITTDTSHCPHGQAMHFAKNWPHYTGTWLNNTRSKATDVAPILLFNVMNCKFNHIVTRKSADISAALLPSHMPNFHEIQTINHLILHLEDFARLIIRILSVSL